jgi:hypothetical protein
VSSSCLRCWGRNSAVVTNSGQVRHALACGHDFCSGRAAIAVEQRHFRASEVLLHPFAVGERSIDRGADGPTTDVDLLGAFPLLANGGVGQGGIDSRHGVAGVVEQPSDHFLGTSWLIHRVAAMCRNW